MPQLTLQEDTKYPHIDWQSCYFERWPNQLALLEVEELLKETDGKFQAAMV